MTRPALLDVNLLVALFDQAHVHHEMAHDWFADHQADGWATCPITENGFVRVLSNPAYGSEVTRPVDLLNRLARFCASKHHRFWGDAVSLLDTALFNHSFIRGHRQVSDVYLLGVAVANGGTLATFDRTIPLAAVTGAGRHTLAVIAQAGSVLPPTSSP
jgi:hypothetical protein